MVESSKPIEPSDSLTSSISGPILKAYITLKRMILQQNTEEIPDKLRV